MPALNVTRTTGRNATNDANWLELDSIFRLSSASNSEAVFTNLCFKIESGIKPAQIGMPVCGKYVMATETMTLDPNLIRADFPILNQTIHKDRQLVYLDNGASTQRPRSVIEAIKSCYEQTYSNVHRGIHFLSEQSTDKYEQARRAVQDLIGARHDYEVIFTSGTTLAINTVAQSWGRENLKQGDEILLTIMEHHSNIVPWQQVAEMTGAVVRFVDINEEGLLDLEDWNSKLSEKTKIVACTMTSNVLGTCLPIKQMVHQAHAVGAKVLVDAAQFVPHEPTDVVELDVDFLTFSGHKMLGPSGIGFLYGKSELLEAMPPFLGGGSMITDVTTEGYTPGELPAKFEAGTPPIVGAIGMLSAIDYLKQVGIEKILDHERALIQVAQTEMEKIPGLTIYGPRPDHKAGIISFTVDGISTQDLAIFMDRRGVALRAGHHCAMPLHERMGIANSLRASFYLYNTMDDVQRFVDALNVVVEKLR